VLAERPRVAEAVGGAEYFAIFLIKINAEWAATDLAIVIDVARDFVEARTGDKERLETGGTGDLGHGDGGVAGFQVSVSRGVGARGSVRLGKILVRAWRR
jgi:hypothetical protein